MTRQYLYQIEHRKNSLCFLCSDPVGPESICLCTRHYFSRRKRLGSKKRYKRESWLTVDWDRPNSYIARKLGVTVEAVLYQRRKRGK